jgi:hypothetical protein
MTRRVGTTALLPMPWLAVLDTSCPACPAVLAAETLSPAAQDLSHILNDLVRRKASKGP